MNNNWQLWWGVPIVLEYALVSLWIISKTFWKGGIWCRILSGMQMLDLNILTLAEINFVDKIFRSILKNK